MCDERWEERDKQRRFLAYKDATKQHVFDKKKHFSTYCSGSELFSAPTAFGEP